MFDYIARLLDTQTLAPHGICLLWRPELLWTHVVSDTLIFGAYMTIPAALAVIIRRRRDIPFSWIIWCFALFITACGFTHLMAIWTLWNADYGIEALVKAVTAIASIATAGALWMLIPVAVSLPSPSDLRAVNEELRKRISERDLAIAELEHEKAQRLRSEEALVQSQKMDALGQLTGGIAHDFNNLLQAVQGSLELIVRRADDPAKVRSLAEGGIQAAQRGGKLTAQLLAFARSKQLKVEPFGAADFVLESRELLAGAAGNLHDLRFDLGADDLTVLADRTQVELALLNLVINARDATPPGGRITIGARRVDVETAEPDLPAGAYVELAVADTGAGMSPDTRSRAFEPFFTTKTVGQGTGLGLSQVYGVARQAGGAARIESREGQGARVALLLPIFDGPPAPADDRQAATRAASLTGAVLVVDDDRHVRDFAANALEALGLKVSLAGDGAEALETFHAAAPDVVLMDYAMPGMTGVEAAKRLADVRPDISIIFMTGYADAEALDHVLGRGAALLRKPFRVDELGAALTLALARARSAGQA